MKSKEICNKIAEVILNRKKPIKNTVQLGRLIGLNAWDVRIYNKIYYCLRKWRKTFEKILGEEYNITTTFIEYYTLEDLEKTFEECQLYCIAEGIPVLFWIDYCWRPLTSFVEYIYVNHRQSLISIKALENSIWRQIFGDTYIDEKGEGISFKEEIIELDSLIKDLKPYTTMRKEEMLKNDEQIISIWKKLSKISISCKNKLNSLFLDMEIKELIKEDD
nr:MAG: hypothetical protein [uncultured archaeon]